VEEGTTRTILDLCGGSGAWSRLYRAAGYKVILVDPASPVPGAVRMDVRLFEPPDRVHGVLAAPPCTHLAGSGARWWSEKGYDALLESLAVVDACVRIVAATCPVWWALENPVGRLVRFLGTPALTFNPCDYGDPYTKRTCLWGTFTVPEKTPVQPVEKSPIHYMAPGPDRTALRSVTPRGFANAFFLANP
jgi:hypothetical protein